MTFFSDLWQDIRYSVRTLRKHPSFAIVAVLALALGIGVNTGIFTILNAIALRPLPVANAGKVVSVYQSFRGKVKRNVSGSKSYFSYPEYLDYRDHNDVFSGLAVSATAHASLGGADAKRIEAQIVSCNYFTVLGRTPVLGREFSKDECATPDGAPVVILSNTFWNSQFHGDPQVVGSVIQLNRRAFTVIGVAPKGFDGTSILPAEIWAPVVMQKALIPGGDSGLSETNWSWLEMIGRLKPGVSIARAHADLAVIAGRIDQSYPGRTTTVSVDTANFLGEPEARTAILTGGTVALLAVGLVLLIACANVANLLLSRAAARQKEIAIRLSAGASRGRLVRQLLTESLLISLAGGALGSILALWTFEALFHLVMSSLPAGIPPIDLNLSPDVRVLLYAVAVSAISGIAFGLAPALQATRPDLVAALKEEGSGFAGRMSRSWLRSALVATQVSVCLVLLIAAGLLTRGLQSAQTLDPGFAMNGVVATSFDLEQQGYDDARALQFHRQLIERISAIPGVDVMSQAATVPLGGSSYGTVVELDGIQGPQQVKFNNVSPAFFSLLGIPIVRGRGFTEAEGVRGASVAVISEATAKRFWPNQEPLGKTFRMGKEKTSYEVIGIARDIRATDLPHVDKTFFYFPAKLEYQKHMSLLAHTNGNLAATVNLIRDTAHSLDANIIVTAKPLEENLEFYRLPSRILASLTTALGLLGLLLASLGIYGVVSYAVSARIREIGIRMTLGANPAGILSLILKQGMRPVMLGVIIGFVACAAASRFLSIMLYGVSPFDPLTFAGVSLFLTGIALLACYLPARRATRVDPMEALRYE